MAAVNIPAVGDPIIEGEIRAAKVTAGTGSSNDVQVTATGVFALFSIDVGAQGNVTIHEVIAEMTTAWVDSGTTSGSTAVTLDVGDGDDADGYLQDNNDIEPFGTAVATSKASGQPYSGLEDYSADDTIDLTVGGAAPGVQGAAEFTVLYSVGID